MKIFKVSMMIFLMMTLFCCRPPEESVLIETFDFTGELIGADLALCACCGGYIYQENDSSTEYRITEFPSDFQATLDTLELPKTINVNYTFVGECNNYMYLKVDEIEVL